MPPIRDTSFVQNQDASINQRQEPKDPFFVLGIIFLIISAIVSAISFGLNLYFENKNTQNKAAIDTLNSSLSKYPLPEMLATYNNITNINSYVQTRNYVSAILYTLESSTEKNVYFIDFSLSNTAKNGYTITMTGIAPDYKTIVKQIDRFKDPKYNKVFKTVTLGNITRSGDVNPKFEVQIVVNTSIPYTQLGIDAVPTSTETISQVQTIPVNISLPATATSSTSTEIN